MHSFRGRKMRLIRVILIFAEAEPWWLHLCFILGLIVGGGTIIQKACSSKEHKFQANTTRRNICICPLGRRIAQVRRYICRKSLELAFLGITPRIQRCIQLTSIAPATVRTSRSLPNVIISRGHRTGYSWRSKRLDPGRGLWFCDRELQPVSRLGTELTCA
jgi:hypothetical protein